LETQERPVKVVIVGVCTAGKSTLAASLRERGFDAYTVAQEHSMIKSMWSLRKPDYVIFLNVSLEEARRRRAVYWGQEMLDVQIKRLADAREHCDTFIDTSDLQALETLATALEALNRRFGGVTCAGDNAGGNTETA
jgi:deoxyadenosine/deoxycytidine kinase